MNGYDGHRGGGHWPGGWRDPPAWAYFAPPPRPAPVYYAPPQRIEAAPAPGNGVHWGQVLVGALLGAIFQVAIVRLTR